MIGGFHADIALGRKIDADRAENFRAERLSAVRDERDLDPADADAGAVAELHLGGAEALLSILDQADHGRLGVDRHAALCGSILEKPARLRLASRRPKG